MTIDISTARRSTPAGGARAAQDARIARWIDRRLGVHRARRRAWRRASGDYSAFPALMLEEGAGYLYHHPEPPPRPQQTARDIWRETARRAMLVTAIYLALAALIVLADLAIQIQTGPYLDPWAGIE